MAEFSRLNGLFKYLQAKSMPLMVIITKCLLMDP